MYLNLLDSNKKLLFRELDLFVANIDGKLHEKEKEIINFHCREMNIDNNEFKNLLTLDETLKQVTNRFSDSEKRMIFLELLSVAMADEQYHIEEKSIIKTLCEYFNISKSSEKKAFESLQELKSAYSNMFKFIEGE